MKIVLTEKQYVKLLLSEGELSSIGPIFVNFTGFAPDKSWKRNEYVYLDDITQDDILKIKKLKQDNVSVDITLKNTDTKENLVFPIEKIKFTQKGIPYIDTAEYEKIKGLLETHKIVLNSDFLKKGLSGFPKFIRDILFSIYKNNLGKNSFIEGSGDCESEIGLIDIKGTNVPGQTWSILNFFDTNPKVIKQLIGWYRQDIFSNKEEGEVESIINFKSWIEKNKENIFKGEKLNELVKLNLNSYTVGLKTENWAIDLLTKPPFNITKDNIEQFCAGVSHDRKSGKDLILKIGKVEKYAQVKPLSWIKYNKETGEFLIGTYSMQDYKNREVDYIIFSTKKNIYVFENKNYKVLNNQTVVFKNPPVTTI